ncbi:MAG: hypothetical protein ACERK6_02350 [Candidatus Aminicenantaceae bacterium]
MTRKFILITLTLFLTTTAYLPAERIGLLPGILEPDGFQISDSEVFILEGATVSVFDLATLSLKRRFGREGQGPGEVEITPWLSNTLLISTDRTAIDSANKLVLYTRDGKLIREKLRQPQFTQVVPWGENYAVRLRIAGTEKDPKQYSSILILSGETNDLRELYRQPFAAQREQLDMIPDSIHFQVHENNLYVEKSPEGFVIDVYDPVGRKIREIRREYEKRPVTSADRLLCEQLLKEDPMMNIQEENWELFKTRTQLKYPESFPAIRDFVIADDRIYVQTFQSNEAGDEFLVLDLEGKLHRSVFLPKVREPGFTERMMGIGVRLFCINEGRYFYLKELTEGCELHMEVLSN